MKSAFCGSVIGEPVAVIAEAPGDHVRKRMRRVLDIDARSASAALRGVRDLVQMFAIGFEVAAGMIERGQHQRGERDVVRPIARLAELAQEFRRIVDRLRHGCNFAPSPSWPPSIAEMTREFARRHRHDVEAHAVSVEARPRRQIERGGARDAGLLAGRHRFPAPCAVPRAFTSMKQTIPPGLRATRSISPSRVRTRRPRMR